MRIGVIGVQGDVSEHVDAVARAMKDYGKEGEAIAVRRATDEGMPIMGTCAGCILLSKDAGTQAEKTKTRLLGLMDMAVDRNAFGRQRESFEAELQVQGLDAPFHCVFI